MDVCLRLFARHQASVTLSSCEAELAAIQSAVQEAIGIQRTLDFAVQGVRQKELTIELRTDSLFACTTRVYGRDFVAQVKKGPGAWSECAFRFVLGCQTFTV